MFKRYYELTKPGIVYGNIMTTVAAFLFASQWHIDPLLQLSTVVGLALVIASACVLNNVIDRHIDAKMERTKHRALVVGTIDRHSAISFAILLGIFGFFILFMRTNVLTTIIAVIGCVFYLVFYSYAKRAGHWGTLVGSVSGAVPIVVGYTAVTNRFDLISLLLFFILACWQMPHFYAIAIRRSSDYRTAHIPVLPLVKGNKTTNVHIVVYIMLFLIATASFAVIAQAGYIFLIIMLAVGIRWLMIAIEGFSARDDQKWARSLFLFSLVVLLVFSITLALSPLLP
ncbi:MAG TPA: heme o synthase [Candidatus Paceibacterota bacterium]|nr:heme o synthase [Candidatus Paceibacterota bacterium]